MPSGWKIAWLTSAVWSENVIIGSPLAFVSHNLTVLSEEAEQMRRESGENLALLTQLEWLTKEATNFLETRLVSFTILSSDPVKRSDMSDEKSTLFTGATWPLTISELPSLIMEVHCVGPDTDSVVGTGGSDESAVGTDNQVVNFLLVPNKFEGSHLRLEVPNDDGTVT